MTNLTSEYCLKNNELVVSPTGLFSGYLASIVTSDTPHCAGHPWVVEVSRGQQLNLTLYDFSMHGNKMASDTGTKMAAASRTWRPDRNNGLVSCREYAIIEDGDKRFTVCGGSDDASNRIGWTYLSSNSIVKIWMTAGVAPTDMRRFLIQYDGQSLEIPIIRKARVKVIGQDSLLRFERCEGVRL